VTPARRDGIHADERRWRPTFIIKENLNIFPAEGKVHLCQTPYGAG